jgi:undecaprenyl pyrophosphate phosphatase UppP
MEQNSEKSKIPAITKWAMASLAAEFGFIIAIPLVVFALAGKWLDARTHTFPLFTLIGVVLAVTSTTIWMYKRLRRFV